MNEMNEIHLINTSNNLSLEYFIETKQIQLIIFITFNTKFAIYHEHYLTAKFIHRINNL